MHECTIPTVGILTITMICIINIVCIFSYVAAAAYVQTI